MEEIALDSEELYSVLSWWENHRRFSGCKGKMFRLKQEGCSIGVTTLAECNLCKNSVDVTDYDSW